MNLHRGLEAEVGHGTSPCLCAALLLALCFAATSSLAQHTFPYGESFETYTNLHQIRDEANWSASIKTAATVVVNGSIVEAQTNYPVNGRSFPLSTTHANILQLEDSVTNDLATATGTIVVVDLMLYPSLRAIVPDIATANNQAGLYFGTNGKAFIWHRNTSGAPTNEWHELTNSPTVSSTAWSRVSLTLDYSNRLYQVRINEGDPIIDGAGWTFAGGTQPGAWFFMPQTNGYLTRLSLKAQITAYADDIVTTNRFLTYSGDTFYEGAPNDGSISNTIYITLQHGAFATTNGADFVAQGRIAPANVPAGLTAVITRTNGTTLAATLSGNASAHLNANDIADLGFTLNNSAFEAGQADGVDGYVRTGMIVDFDDQPSLAYNKSAFGESAANDGSIDNSSPMVITLTRDTFNGSLGDDFVAQGKITVGNLPAGLFAVITNTTPSNLVAVLTNQASSHAQADSVMNLTFTFQDSAFVNAAAADIDSSTRSDLQINFADAKTLLYGAEVFTEKSANNGSVNGTTISLLLDTFTGNNGDNFVQGSTVTVANLPAGLFAIMTRDGDTQLTLTFTNEAGSHADSDDVSNLTFTFGDVAFAGGSAASVSNSARSDLDIDFNDPPTLTYAGGTFFEGSGNNGSISNAIDITLSSTTGDAFLGADSSDMVAGGRISVANLPAGLTAVITKNNASNLTASLTGNAGAHASANSIANLTFTFQDSAFNLADADQVVNYNKTDLVVNFDNQPVLNYSREVFDEFFEGTIDNTSPLEITLTSGTSDAFTGTAGDNFVSAGKVVVANLPAGLTAVMELINSTRLDVTLTGTATSHADANDVNNLTFTFLDTVFTLADASQVVNYNKSDLSVDFDDTTSFINTVPYAESFETYDNGFYIRGTNGWGGTSATAGTVSNASEIVNALTNYPVMGKQFPLNDTNHTQVLCIDAEVSDEIKGGSQQNLFTDFMLRPTGRDEQPTGTTNHQFGFYIPTNNFQLYIWHRDMTGTPSNTWHQLTNSPVFSTTTWYRVTVQHDYTNSLFQVMIDENDPLSDAKGWTAAGGSQPGTWFFMVKTNQLLSRIRISSGNPLYIDDLKVTPEIPNFLLSSAVATLYILK